MRIKFLDEPPLDYEEENSDEVLHLRTKSGLGLNLGATPTNTPTDTSTTLRPWSWTDPIREGAAGLVQSFGPSDMETERLQSLIGLDDNQFIEAVRAGHVRRDEWPLGRMPQERRDALLQGKIAQRMQWRQNIDEAAEYVAPTPHAEPEGLLQQAGDYTLRILPEAAKTTAEYLGYSLLGPIAGPAAFGVSKTLSGINDRQEYVYRNLREQGLSPEEARQETMRAGPNLLDLGIRGTANIATMGALSSPVIASQLAAHSPIAQTLGNIGRASLYSGAGAVADRALTQYRSNIDNTLEDLTRAGLTAAGSTAIMGLAGAALNGRKLWELQKYYYDIKPLEATFADTSTTQGNPPRALGGNNPDTPALPGEYTPKPPSNPSGGRFSLTEPTPEQAANSLYLYNTAVARRGFNPISNAFNPIDSFAEIRSAVGQGYISPEEARAMLVEGGITPEIADTVVDVNTNASPQTQSTWDAIVARFNNNPPEQPQSGGMPPSPTPQSGGGTGTQTGTTIGTIPQQPIDPTVAPEGNVPAVTPSGEQMGTPSGYNPFMGGPSEGYSITMPAPALMGGYTDEIGLRRFRPKTTPIHKDAGLQINFHDGTMVIDDPNTGTPVTVYVHHKPNSPYVEFSTAPSPRGDKKSPEYQEGMRQFMEGQIGVYNTDTNEFLTDPNFKNAPMLPEVQRVFTENVSDFYHSPSIVTSDKGIKQDNTTNNPLTDTGTNNPNGAITSTADGNSISGKNTTDNINPKPYSNSEALLLPFSLLRGDRTVNPDDFSPTPNKTWESGSQIPSGAQGSLSSRSTRIRPSTQNDLVNTDTSSNLNPNAGTPIVPFSLTKQDRATNPSEFSHTPDKPLDRGQYVPSGQRQSQHITPIRENNLAGRGARDNFNPYNTKEPPAMSRDEEFRQAFGRLQKGGSVHSYELRDALNWPREEFDNMVRRLQVDEVIQAHPTDPSRLSDAQVNSAFVDNNGNVVDLLSWTGAQAPEVSPNTLKSPRPQTQPSTPYADRLQEQSLQPYEGRPQGQLPSSSSNNARQNITPNLLRHINNGGISPSERRLLQRYMDNAQPKTPRRTTRPASARQEGVVPAPRSNPFAPLLAPQQGSSSQSGGAHEGSGQRVYNGDFINQVKRDLEQHKKRHDTLRMNPTRAVEILHKYYAKDFEFEIEDDNGMVSRITFNPKRGTWSDSEHSRLWDFVALQALNKHTAQDLSSIAEQFIARAERAGDTDNPSVEFARYIADNLRMVRPIRNNYVPADPEYYDCGTEDGLNNFYAEYIYPNYRFFSFSLPGGLNIRFKFADSKGNPEGWVLFYPNSNNPHFLNKEQTEIIDRIASKILDYRILQNKGLEGAQLFIDDVYGKIVPALTLNILYPAPDDNDNSYLVQILRDEAPRQQETIDYDDIRITPFSFGGEYKPQRPKVHKYAPKRPSVHKLRPDERSEVNVRGFHPHAIKNRVEVHTLNPEEQTAPKAHVHGFYPRAHVQKPKVHTLPLDDPRLAPPNVNTEDEAINFDNDLTKSFSPAEVMDSDGFVGQLNVWHLGKVHILDVFVDEVNDKQGAEKYGPVLIRMIGDNGDVASYMPAVDVFYIDENYATAGWTREIEDTLRENLNTIFKLAGITKIEPPVRGLDDDEDEPEPVRAKPEIVERPKTENEKPIVMSVHPKGEPFIIKPPRWLSVTKFRATPMSDNSFKIEYILTSNGTDHMVNYGTFSDGVIHKNGKLNKVDSFIVEKINEHIAKQQDNTEEPQVQTDKVSEPSIPKPEPAPKFEKPKPKTPVELAEDYLSNIKNGDKPETSSEQQPVQKPTASTAKKPVEDTESGNIAPALKIAEEIKKRVIEVLEDSEAEITPISNRDLFDIADEAYGGTQGEGKYTVKDAYDAMELGINMAIKDFNNGNTFRIAAMEDGRELIWAFEDLDRILQLIPTQRNRTDEQIEFQQFSTPPTLALLVNWLANIYPRQTVLEPSAGLGGLAVFAHASDANLILNELNARRADLLDSLNLSVIVPGDEYSLEGKAFRENAEQINNILAPQLSEDERPDRVIMNPPFSATAGRVKKHDAHHAGAHIEQALKLLKDNGRLVAILSKSMSDDNSSFRDWWKHIRKKYNVVAIIKIDGSAYKKFGTTWGNIIAVIDKNGDTPANGTLHYTFNGSFSDRRALSDLINALAGVQADVPDAEDVMEAEDWSEEDMPNFTLSEDDEDFINGSDVWDLGNDENDNEDEDSDIDDTEYLQWAKETEEKKAPYITLDPEQKWQADLLFDGHLPSVFKRAFDKLDNGDNLVSLKDIRGELHWWNKAHEDYLISLLEKNGIITLKRIDSENPSFAELQSRYKDNTGAYFTHISWNKDNGGTPTKKNDTPSISSTRKPATKSPTENTESGEAAETSNLTPEEINSRIAKTENKSEIEDILQTLSDNQLKDLAKREEISLSNANNKDAIISRIAEVTVGRFKNVDTGGTVIISGAETFGIPIELNTPLMKARRRANIPEGQKTLLPMPDGTKYSGKEIDAVVNQNLNTLIDCRNEEEMQKLLNTADGRHMLLWMCDNAGIQEIGPDDSRRECINALIRWTVRYKERYQSQPPKPTVSNTKDKSNADTQSTQQKSHDENNTDKTAQSSRENTGSNETETTTNPNKTKRGRPPKTQKEQPTETTETTQEDKPKRGRTPKTQQEDKPTGRSIEEIHSAASRINIGIKSAQERKAEEIQDNKAEESRQSTSNIDDADAPATQEISINSYYHSSITGFAPHPGILVESTAMKSVQMPPASYIPKLPPEIQENGLLSEAQIEPVVYAGRAFKYENVDGTRRGFFIGDGTGVGKGREISAIIMDALAQGYGQGKAVWLSDKHSLIQDAKRDWSGLGNNPDDIIAHEKKTDSQLSNINQGILFSAYSYMESKDRVKQIKDWLGEDFDGIIVLDECHNVNNVLSEDEKGHKVNPATAAVNTRDLIKALPKARVLYVSATGATEVRNLAMLDRLGLWGTQAPFKTVNDFVSSISKGGTAAMELVARDLKAMGLFTARTLSMDGVTFRTLETPLNTHQTAIYDKLAECWQIILQNLKEALELCGGEESKRFGGAEGKFWGFHQRFFNQIILTLQAPAMIKDIERELDKGHSAVIQLTNTFESAQEQAVANLTGEKKKDEFIIKSKDGKSYKITSKPLKKTPIRYIIKPVIDAKKKKKGKSPATPEAFKKAYDTVQKIDKKIALIADLRDELGWNFSTFDNMVILLRSAGYIKFVDNIIDGGVNPFNLSKAFWDEEGQCHYHIEWVGENISTGSQSEGDITPDEAMGLIWDETGLHKAQEGQNIDVSKYKFLEEPIKAHAEQMKAEGKTEVEKIDYEDLDISPRNIMLQFLMACFPIQQMEEYEDDDGNTRTRPVLDSYGRPVVNPEAVKKRDELIAIVNSIKQFPESPLDLILDHFGAENVAEITGRSRRFIRDSNGIRVEEKRNAAKAQAEINSFNAGRRRILIFSEKGGTGASYHASNDYENQQKRIHYLFQPGWRASKAMQGLGRTHRSNEAQQPEYVLVTTDVPGQKRFLSTIARRLEQLGALSTGERKSNTQGLFSENDNLEASYVHEGMVRMFKKLINGKYPELPDASEIFQELGFDIKDFDSIDGAPTKLPSITRFLNRILSMTVEMQKKLFARFEEEVDTRRQELKDTGRFDMRTEDVRAKSINILQENVVATSREYGTETKYVELELIHSQRPRSFEAMLNKGADFYIINETGDIVAAVPQKSSKTDIDTGQTSQKFTLYFVDSKTVKPSAAHLLANQSDSQTRHFTKLDINEARKIWEKQSNELPNSYIERKHMITGALLPVWKMLGESNIRVQRVKTADGREFLGRIIPDKDLQTVLSRLGLRYSSSKKYTAESLRSELEKMGNVATLANRMKLKFSRVNGEKRLEVFDFDFFLESVLIKQGALLEIINGKRRIFIKTGDDDLLNSLLKESPVINIAQENKKEDTGSSSNLYFIHPFFRFNPDDNPYINQSQYAFSNPETEERWQKSKKPNKRKTITELLTEGVKNIYRGFRSDLPDLLDDDRLIKAQEWLRKLKRERKADVQETIQRLLDALKHLTMDDFDLFSRAMQLMDLKETREIEPEAELPWGMDDNSLYADYSRIMMEVDNNPRVSDAIDKAEQLGQELTDELIQAAEDVQMFDIKQKLQRKHYFRHIVVDYYQQASGSTSKANVKNINRRGYMKHREGSDKDILSDWITAMGEVWARMNGDIKVLHTLKKLRDEYDIIEDLKQQAFRQNQENALYAIMLTLKGIPPEQLRAKAAEVLERKMMHKQAQSIARLFKLAQDGELPTGKNHEWAQFVHALAQAGVLESLGDYERDLLPRYIGWLAGLERKSRARATARRFLKGDISKQSGLKSILGKKYVQWQDLIPDDYDLWSPSDSKLVFSANSVSENVLLLAQENLDELLGIPLSDIGKAMNSGGDKQLWCIPAKLADTLNSLGKSQPQGALALGMKKAMNAFKRWVLLTPFGGRVIKYNWRNFFGDLEAVLQGNPGALWYLNQAIRELSDSMLKGNKATGMLAEFNKRGGALTTEFISELENWEDLKEFAHLFDSKGHINPLKIGVNMVKGYVKLASMLTNFRESILRYAAFLSYVKLIQDNEGKTPFYGMSKPKEVEALKDDIYDMAFKLANENLGAYDQLSQNAQWLRDNNWLSFFSWVEVNFKRSIQMYRNIWSGNSYLEYWLKKHGGDFVNKFIAGAGGNGNSGNGNKPPKSNGDADWADDNNEARKIFRRICNMIGKSPAYILRFAITLALSMPLMLILGLFNWLNGENEEKLPPEIRDTPHLTLWSNDSTGEILYLSRLGSAVDFFETIGMDGITRDVKDIWDGKMSAIELPGKIINGPVSKLVNNFNPYAKALIEMQIGRRFYPDIRHPTPIRDNYQYLAQAFSLDWYYRAITGKAHAPASDMSSSFATAQSPEQAAYWFIISKKKEFQERVLGKEVEMFIRTKKGEALYNARQAAQMQDWTLMRKYLREFYKAGGTEEGLKASLRSIEPLHGLNEEEQMRFIRSLSSEERKSLRQATKFAERLKAKLSF